jgi:hypothetical protein
MRGEAASGPEHSCADITAFKNCMTKSGIWLTVCCLNQLYFRVLPEHNLTDHAQAHPIPFHSLAPGMFVNNISGQTLMALGETQACPILNVTSCCSLMNCRRKESKINTDFIWIKTEYL